MLAWPSATPGIRPRAGVAALASYPTVRPIVSMCCLTLINALQQTA